MATSNVIHESKKLILELKENEARYISGELDLNPTLDRTDKLFEDASKGELVASKAFQDSDLIKLQIKIAKDSARAYQIDTLVFDAASFCEKVKSSLCPDEYHENDDAHTSRRATITKLWKKLGEYGKGTMNTVPICSFIYGTFDADPVEPVKKVRKQVIKDKIGDLTKPLQVTPGTALNEQDVMLRDADRVYTIFNELIKKSKKQAICFYEFVTDPDSFTRTVENIFLVSLLVKDGHVCIFDDEQGLPCLKKMHKSEKNSFNAESTNQSVLSICSEDWKDIVKTFKFKKAVIPPRTT